MTNPTYTILRVRPSKEDEKEKPRGPLYAESAISALHTLKKEDTPIHLEVGTGDDGRITFIVRSTEVAAQLAQSQLYAQYSNIDIDHEPVDPFTVHDGEEVTYADLVLRGPEVLPIKRHPQFDDMLSRVNINPIAGVTSALARYPVAGMRGHVQVVIQPLGGTYRKRALRFLPLLNHGISSVSLKYANFFTRIHLVRGWRRVAYLPLSIAMGGFRAWPGFNKFLAGSITMDAPTMDDEEREHVTARSHDREDSIAAAQDKVNRLLFMCNVRVSVIAKRNQRREALQKLEEIVSSFQQFALPQANVFGALPPLYGSRIPSFCRRNCHALAPSNAHGADAQYRLGAQ
jgi:hypothetical protein